MQSTNTGQNSLVTKENSKEKILDYLVNFLEVPNKEFGGFPPCPFAKAERLKNKILIKNYDSSEESFIDCVKNMVDSGYETGIFALFENDSLVSLEDSETRSFQKFLNKVLKENDLKSYRSICVNPNDKLDVNGIKVRGLAPCFLINVGLKKAFGKTHKSLMGTKYYENFPETYKKYLKVK